MVGLKAPGNFGADYKARFDAIYPDLAAQYGAVLVPSFFAPLISQGDPAAAQALMQTDGIHPNAEGVKRIVAALGPKVVELLDRVAN